MVPVSLTGVTQQLPAPAAQAESYTYDPEGNRIASHLSAAYVTDAANHLLDDGINTYTWDPSGFLASRTPKNNGAATTYIQNFYGLENGAELEKVFGPFPLQFTYDNFQRLNLISWTADPSKGGYGRHYDGDDMVLEERNAYGNAPQWVRYVHGQGIDQPLAMEIYPAGAAPTPGTGQAYYYHADGEGSIRLLTDSNAQVADRYDYDSFGRRLTATESVAQPYGWKGREWLAGPDLLYNRARWYDPLMGRFISEDPIGYGGGQSNMFAFAGNNPKNWNDPSGLDPEEAGTSTTTIGLAGGAVAVGAAGVIETGADAALIAAESGSTLQVVGARAACIFFALSDVLDFASDPSLAGAVSIAIDTQSCGAKAKPFPKMRGPGCSWAGVFAYFSFEEGTEVEAEDGERKIEDIKIGDLVASRDAFDSTKTLRRVTELFRRSAPGIVRLTLIADDGRNETIGVTSEHPFFVTGKGWTAVRKLAVATTSRRTRLTTLLSRSWKRLESRR